MPGPRLTMEERIRMEVLWTQGMSFPDIATEIGRDRTTVWREVDRNHSYRHGPKNPRGKLMAPNCKGDYAWGYEARMADLRARQRARRPRPCRLGPGQPLRLTVKEMLCLRWSPQQIEAALKIGYPDQPEMQVAHETIYRALYVQGRGNLRDEVSRQIALRTGRAARRPQSRIASAARSRKPWTVGLNISDRPAEALDRAVPGHWEGDLVIGRAGSSAIVTLVERSTRFVLLGALQDGRVSEQVIDRLSNLIGVLPGHLARSLTWDCGSEMTTHAKFTVTTGCPVYFCDPHSPWQRGSNENTNGLLRQYYPKGQTDFRRVTQAELDDVAAELNGRPRKTLGWKNPAEALNKLLVATAG